MLPYVIVSPDRIPAVQFHNQRPLAKAQHTQNTSSHLIIVFAAPAVIRGLNPNLLKYKEIGPTARHTPPCISKPDDRS
jgi:hypothetical protein